MTVDIKHLLPLSFVLQLTFLQQLQPPAPPSWTWKVSWASRPAFCRSRRTSFRRRPSPRTPAPPSSASLRLWTTTTTSGVWKTARGCRTFSTRMISGICCRTEGQRRQRVVHEGGGYLIQCLLQVGELHYKAITLFTIL